MRTRVHLLCVLALMLGYVSQAFSQQVSPTSALEKATRFLRQGKPSAAAVRKAPRRAPQLELANNRSEFYVFNDKANGGYVIVSGDERMPDVLGYSHTGTFDEHIPDNMRSWLEGYAMQVKHLRSNPDMQVDAAEQVQRKPVSPLLTCQWSQWKPYNLKCPVVTGGQSTPTGCVATAMAQIMYYHKWPEQTSEVIPAYATSTAGLQIAEQPVTTIRWDRLKDRFHPYSVDEEDPYTEEQGEAIATLMRLCGSAVQMDYLPYESRAAFSPEAMHRYFNYNADIAEIKHYNFTNEEWNHIIYTELENKRPIFYIGHNNDETPGHAFVVDGYDKDDYFHINWGWGEQALEGGHNGYYVLTTMPKYNVEQYAYIGIVPLKPETVRPYAALDHGKLTFYYDNKHASREADSLYDIGGMEYKEVVTEIEIDPSFANYKTAILSNLFRDFYEAKTIKGLEYLNTERAYFFDGLFAGCSSLQELDLSRLNTSHAVTMESMFYGCMSLKSLDLRSFNTSQVKTMSNMFWGCDSLATVNLSSFNTSHVTDMTSMFENCSSLVSLDLRSFNTSHVTDMTSMFEKCSSLVSLDVSSFDTSSLIDLNHIFRYCSSLKTLDLRSFSKNKIQSLKELFYGCSSLESVDLRGFDTSHVTSMNRMFYGCSSLVSPDLRNFDTSHVTDMSEMFVGCSSLVSPDLRGLNTSHVTNMSGMFGGCSSLVSPDLRSLDMSNVTNASGMFSGCSSLQSPGLRGFDTGQVTNMERMFGGCTSLVSPDLSSLNTSHVTNMESMFEGCTSLVSPNLSSFNKNQVTNMERMFKDCTSLVSPDLNSLNTSHVTNMKSMFKGCTALTSLDLRGFNTSQVTSMRYMFSDCSSLKTLDLSSFNTSSVTDMMLMFERCTALETLDLRSFNKNQVTSMFYMFAKCSALKSIDLRGFDTSHVTDMNSMFEGCSSLTSLDLSSFNTDSLIDMSRMFSYCSALTSVDLSSFNTGKVGSMKYTFGQCKNLKTIYVGKEWAKPKKGEDMFSGCWNLVGAQGTRYDMDNDNLEHARIDGGISSPGYLTYKETTGIIGPRVTDIRPSAIYNLNGVMVKGSDNGHRKLPKGLYIYGGKKVVVQ